MDLSFTSVCDGEKIIILQHKSNARILSKEVNQAHIIPFMPIEMHLLFCSFLHFSLFFHHSISINILCEQNIDTF